VRSKGGSRYQYRPLDDRETIERWMGVRDDGGLCGGPDVFKIMFNHIRAILNGRD